MNLVVNARDAMPGGGVLTIRTSNVEFGDGDVKGFIDLKPGRYVLMTVTDTGTGMTAETKRRLFEPFFTTKPVGVGTGLGLSMVYGIVKQHGGEVSCYSELGLGSTFKVYWPATDQPSESAASQEAHQTPYLGDETILLVEDDPQLRQLSSSVLAHCGYKMLVAATPEEGLAMCKANHGDIRLLITDVVMPRINGRQLAEQIIQVSSAIKVLYISGYTNNAIVHYGVLDPGLWFLPKPFTLAALMAKVREVLDSSTSEPQGEQVQ
jgi:CheY-like chemotaxis protein